MHGAFPPPLTYINDYFVKWFLKNELRVWIGLIWLRVWTRGGLFLGDHKINRMPFLSTQTFCACGAPHHNSACPILSFSPSAGEFRKLFDCPSHLVKWILKNGIIWLMPFLGTLIS
jgi:hypothetical protein